MTDEQFIQLERKASLGRCLLNDMQQLEDALRCSEGSHFYNMTVKVFPPYNLPGEPRECVFRMITKELNDQIRDMIRGELTRLKKAFVEL